MAVRKTSLLIGTILSGLMLAPSAAHAQASASPYTSATRYDAERRVTGTISPDPDGGGALPFRAVRNTYDAAGRLTKVETGTLSAWQSEAVAPASWSGFTVAQTLDTAYDAMGRKLKDTLSSGGTAHSVTQYSYDSMGRLECTAVRMNPAVFTSLPSSACTLGTQGSHGPDRITRQTYHRNGQVERIQTGYATSEQRDQIRREFTVNGLASAVIEPTGARAELRYDGHDRQTRWVFPHASTPGQVNESDYESYVQDANGNRTSIRRRDGTTISYSYDALNRMTAKDLPGTAIFEYDQTFAYDLLGRMTAAVNSNTHAVRFTYDALGGVLSEGSDHYGAKTFQYDQAGRRTRMTWRDGLYVDYDYLVTGEMAAIRENGATSGIGVLATFGYDDLGRRTSLTRGNGTSTTYSYDGVSRLTSLAQDLTSSGSDLTLTMNHNPAGQIVTQAGAHGTYAFTLSAGDLAATHNRLNQVTAAGGTSISHDGRGNISAIGGTGYSYTAENLLALGGGAGLAYDALGRLYARPATAEWQDYAGTALVTEISYSTNTITRRYVHGPGVDEPLVWYEGAGTSDRRWLHADERGSIVTVSDASGAALGYNAYDDYGRPQYGTVGAMLGRFGYTGQAWLPEIGLWYYKARAYHADLGRFMQTDPIGYDGGYNLYPYVFGDPVNATDPDGTQRVLVPGCISCHSSSTPSHRPSISSPALPNIRPLLEPGLRIIVTGIVCAVSPTACPAIAPQALLNEGRPTGDDVGIDEHTESSLGDRGWTEEGVRDLTRTDPAGTSTDNRTVDGERRNDSATVYGSRDGYVVVNDRTGEVVQVSDKNDSNWAPDGRIRWRHPD